MSSQPPSPSASLDHSQHNNNNNNNNNNNSDVQVEVEIAQEESSSPHSKADSAVHIEDDSEKADPDSSFQSTNAESERHPKGKRKRTAAKDKAILEASYSANPKPDKAARLDIVKRVSLNEKEVQIWFQNRRQNDRRKSRPLSPQEIAALRYGVMQVLSDPVPYNDPPSSGPQSSDTSNIPVEASQEGENNATPGSVLNDDYASPRNSQNSEVEVNEARHQKKESVTSMPGYDVPSSQPLQSTMPQLSQPLPSSVGYISNRWNPGRASFSTPSTFQRQDTDDSLRFRASTGSAPVLPPPSSSQVRLTMSLEGKAELISSQPSPPRLSPSASSDGPIPAFRRAGLQRSHSAAPTITLPPISTLTASLQSNMQHQSRPYYPPRFHHGRSRDVHAWELACDAENAQQLDDELTAQAERESSGSAIAAISLLRSTSSTSLTSIYTHHANVLQPNGAKRNVRPSNSNHHNPKRTKLGRASSSVARLQTNFVKTSTMSREKEFIGIESGKGKASMLLSPSGNDSDKENWSPDEDGNPVYRNAPRVMGGQRRPLPPVPASKTMSNSSQGQNPRRRAMMDAGGMNGGNRSGRVGLGAGGRSNTAPANFRRRKGAAASPVEIFEDGSDEEDNDEEEGEDGGARRNKLPDDEVERFMRGEVSPSKRGDVDCVAGLLALSQGNWR